MATTARAKEVMQAVNSTLKSDVLRFGSDPTLKVSYLPTGILPIDQLLQGGVPRGRFITIIGDYCLAPETLVLNAEYNWVPLGSLRVGDPIVAFDEEPQEGRGQQRQLRHAHVERVTTKTLPCFEIETDKGTRTVASVGHKWLALQESQRSPEWRTTEQIGVGDKIAYFGDTWGKPEDREAAAYLAGLFDGEGWVDNSRIAFAQNPGPVLDNGIKMLERLGFSVSVRSANGNSTGCMSVQVLGGYRELMRFGGQIPSIRLAPKIEHAWVGKSLTKKGRNAVKDDSWATVTKITYVGDRTVVAIGTSTKTLIADGMFTHNSTLKSYIGLKCIAETQRSGGVAALIDTEHSFDPEWAASLGVDVDSLVIAHPETGEEGIDAAEVMTRNGVDLIVFDSIAAALPQAERGKRMHGESMQPARTAQLMSAAARKLTAANKHTAFIWINQYRINVGMTFGNPEVATGGRAMPYYSSYIIAVKKVGKITRPVEQWDGEDMVKTKEQIGQKYKVTIEKSKLSKPFREVYFTWDMEKADVDVPGYLIASGLEAGTITRSNATWTFGEQKYRGKEVFRKAVESDPKLQAAIIASVKTGKVSKSRGTPAAAKKKVVRRRSTS